MPVLLYLALINVLVRIAAAVIRKQREPKPEPVGTTCSFAHMQYAVSGKRAISCTFAGGVRPMTIDVMYCSDYRDRSAPRCVAIVGFVQALDEAEVVAEVATAGRLSPRGCFETLA